MIDDGAETDLHPVSDDDAKAVPIVSVLNGCPQSDANPIGTSRFDFAIVFILIEFAGLGECAECHCFFNFADSFCALSALDDKHPMIDNGTGILIASTLNVFPQCDSRSVVIFRLDPDIVLVVIKFAEFNECTECLFRIQTF